MRIAIVDTLGLCYDGTTLTKRGLGGSESAVIRMSQELAKIGFDVTVYNDCTSDDSRAGVYDGVNYTPLQAAHSPDVPQYDVLIVSRSVRPYMEDWPICNRARHKVLWMHDTFCEGDNEIETLILQGRINEIFTLSDWHTAYVTHADHGRRRNFDILKNHIFLTRNGIGNMNPGWIDVREKDPNLFVFNASVTKGMVPLVKDIWPRVKQQIPQAKLKVIGGYYRFRSDHGPDQQEKDWRQMVQDHPEIDFAGVIPQQEISEILRKASYMIYPAAFPETYGISTLEALAHNVPLITCRFGALEETALDIASYKIPYPVEPNWSLPWLDKQHQVNVFVDAVVRAYNDKYLHQQKMYACNQVKDICGWDSVALQWKQHFYKKLGEYLPIDEYRKVSKLNHKVRKTFGRRFMNEEELSDPKQGPFSAVTVVTPVYNAEKYIAKCIKSVASQDYPNWQMIIIDDASTDNTLAEIYKTIDDLPHITDQIQVIENAENMGAVHNQVWAIKEWCDDWDIVMLLDGDDWLVNDPNIFHMYNNLYNDGAEFTYGSCWSLADNIPLIAQEYPPDVKYNGTYRDYKFNWNMPYTHLRTFRASMMHDHTSKHGNQAFMDEDGNWLKAGGDTAVFYTMIEAADPDKVVCVPNIVYNYNDLNPLNDYKVNGEEQNKNAAKVMKKTPYKGKFSVVMPTMWRCANMTLELLTRMANHELVDEIFVINNDVERTPKHEILDHPNVFVINEKENIGVNPAWNKGVALSRNERICITNDDVLFDVKVFDKIHDKLTPTAGVFGLIVGDPALGQPPSTDYSIDFKEWQPGDQCHCFGQLMFVNRKNYPKLPDGLIINFGDNIIFEYQLFNNRKNYLIYNIEFESEWSPTVKDTTIPLMAKHDQEVERRIYESWKTNFYQKKEQPVTEKKKILIGIPTARYIEPETFKSIYDLEVPDGYEVSFQYFYGYNVDQVRNLIAHWVVGGYDYLFAVDHDIIFRPDTLKRLLAANKDVVSGLYRQRVEPQEIIEIFDFNLQHIPYSQLRDRGLVKVGACGFGCVLVKKEVFAAVGYPYFVYKSAIDHANTFSEDLDFCTKARDKGFEIWADTSIICDHYGQKTYSIDLTPPAPPVLEEPPIRKRLRQVQANNTFPEAHANYLKKISEDGVKPRVIYDIGANVLHWTQAAKNVWPDAHYVAFDATRELDFLYQEAGVPYVAGAVLYHTDNAEIEFYENVENPAGNSMYRENEEFSPNAATLYNENTKVLKTGMTLDSLVKEFNFPAPDMIKMDIQGAELDALKGATKALETCTDIILEMQNVEYNKGAVKAPELIEYLESIGYEMVSDGQFCGNEIDGDYHFRKK